MDRRQEAVERQTSTAPLNQVSSETRPYLDMRFTGQQGVKGELTLPPDVEAKNIAIEAKPCDKKHRGASGKFDWTADG